MDDVEWIVAQELVDYREAERFMEERVAQIRAGSAREAIWLLEHAPLYSAGTSAQPKDLLNAASFPVYSTKRGGQYTYHGPGQRVIYVMLDLEKRGKDVRAFVKSLEHWVIATLQEFGIHGVIRDGRVGVWVTQNLNTHLPLGQGQEDKIAALGIRLRKWVSFHGISINVAPNMSHFDGIVPCGLPQFGVTSFQRLGLNVTLDELDSALRDTFGDYLGAKPL